jgi:hypothetical protein
MAVAQVAGEPGDAARESAATLLEAANENDKWTGANQCQ